LIRTTAYDQMMRLLVHRVVMNPMTNWH